LTGIDLVEQMIRMAAGERWHHPGRCPRLDGWAVEPAYADDPIGNFLPPRRALDDYRPPQECSVGDVTVRNDAGVAEGSEISIFYDP
jgi:propionyl-CoA carboxylase alpha chain